MAVVDWEGRAAKFVRRVARQLCNDASAVTLLRLPPSHLERLLRESIDALPQNPLRSVLQKGFSQFLNQLLHEVRASRSDLPFLSEVAANNEAGTHTDPPMGSLLTDAEYVRAAEAVISAAERVVPSEDASKWRFASERLLLARTNPPLALLWAYLALSKATEPNFGEITAESEKLFTLLSIEERLWQCLKTVTCGLVDSKTAVAAMAPITVLLFDLTMKLYEKVKEVTAIKVSEENTFNVKGYRRLLKRLRSVIEEILTFVAMCRQRKYRYCQNFLVSSNSSMLNRGLSQKLEKFVELLNSMMLMFTSAVEWSKFGPLQLIQEAQQKRRRKRDRLAYLADAVSIHIFFMRLMVSILESKIGSQSKNQDTDLDVHKKLKLAAIHSAACISSLSSYEMLLDMLLEPHFPMPIFLAVEEEAELKEGIYEAVICVDPLHFGWSKDEAFREDSGTFSLLFLKRVAVCRQLMKFFRLPNQWSKVQSLLMKVSSLFAPPHLVSWLSSVDFQKFPKNLKGSHAVTDWLLKVADEPTFEAILRLYTNIIQQKDAKSSKPERELPSEDKVRPAAETRNDSDNGMFFVDTQGEDASVKENEEAELAAVHEGFLEAAKKMGNSRKNLKKKASILFQRHQQFLGSKRQRVDAAEESSDESI